MATTQLNDEETAVLIEENDRFQRVDSLAEMIAQMPVKNPKTRAIMEAAGFTDEQMTNDAAMLLGLQLKAQNGDPSAAKLLAEMRGQYSTRVEVEPIQPKPLIDLTDAIEEKPQKGGKK